jgi:hypothetical protein
MRLSLESDFEEELRVGVRLELNIARALGIE